LSQTDTLRKLERKLESFLERAVRLKNDRLQVLDGINRLDDIALGIQMGKELSEDVGDWFADHNEWLTEGSLRPGDHNRIGKILEEIQGELDHNDDSSAAMGKIRGEIDRWREGIESSRQKLVLRRGPETAVATDTESDTITLFDNTFTRIRTMLTDLSDGRVHLLSVLDETLKKAQMQNDKEALILSGLIIYYLKQESYKVEPYVKRLKNAERRIKGLT
jgi:hypothetical protein